MKITDDLFIKKASIQVTYALKLVKKIFECKCISNTSLYDLESNITTLKNNLINLKNIVESKTI